MDVLRSVLRAGDDMSYTLHIGPIHSRSMVTILFLGARASTLTVSISASPAC